MWNATLSRIRCWIAELWVRYEWGGETDCPLPLPLKWSGSNLWLRDPRFIAIPQWIPTAAHNTSQRTSNFLMPPPCFVQVRSSSEKTQQLQQRNYPLFPHHFIQKHPPYPQWRWTPSFTPARNSKYIQYLHSGRQHFLQAPANSASQRLLLMSYRVTQPFKTTITQVSVHMTCAHYFNWQISLATFCRHCLSHEHHPYNDDPHAQRSGSGKCQKTVVR